MILNRKQKPQDPTEGALRAAVAKLKGSCTALDARDKELLERLLRLEKSSLGASGTAEKELTESLLAGEKFVIGPPLPSEIEAIRLERKEIAKALRVGLARLTDYQNELAAKIREGFFDEIAEMERERVFLAIRLQRIDVARETLREKLGKAGAATFLSTDDIYFLDLPSTNDQVHLAGERLIADGCATRAEIDKARNSSDD